MYSFKNLTFFIIGLLSISFLVIKTPSFFDRINNEYKNITLPFEYIEGITIGTNIKYKGIIIGEVEKITLNNNKVDILAKIDKTYNSLDFNNSYYSIESESLLHGKYILLKDKTQNIKIDNHLKNTNMSSLINNFQKTSSTFEITGSKLNKILTNNNITKVDQIISNTENITNNINKLLIDNNANITNTLENINAASKKASNAFNKIDSLLTNIDNSKLILEGGVDSYFNNQGHFNSTFFNFHYYPNDNKFYTIGAHNNFDFDEKSPRLQLDLLYNILVDDYQLSFGVIKNSGGFSFTKKIKNLSFSFNAYDFNHNIFKQKNMILDISSYYLFDFKNTEYKFKVFTKNTLNENKYYGFGFSFAFEDKDLLLPLKALSSFRF